VKKIINISLGPASEDYHLETEFRGQSFSIQRFGTGEDLTRAEDLLLKWNKRANVICISGIKYPPALGTKGITHKKNKRIASIMRQAAHSRHNRGNIKPCQPGMEHSKHTVCPGQQLFYQCQCAVLVRYGKRDPGKGHVRIYRQFDVCRPHH